MNPSHAPGAAAEPGPSILPIRLGFVNAYLARTSDGGFVLVDAGTPRDWAKLEKALAAAGCTKGTLRLVVATHGDFDHIGCAKRLRNDWGAPVAAHPADRGLMERGDMQGRRGSSAPIRVLMALMPERRPRGDADAAGSPFLAPDVLLEDGQSLAAYGWDATVLHTPGHTAGEIAILTGQGDLIVGDTARNHGRPKAGILVQDAEAYDASLARLAALPGVTACWPGHGKPFPLSALPRRLGRGARG